MQRFGLHTVHWRKTDESLVRLADETLRTMTAARQHFPDFDITRTRAFAPDLLAAHPLEPFDQPLDAYLRRLGFSETQIEYMRRSYANAAGEAIHRLSARAALEDWGDQRFGDGDYRVLDGYDTLHQRLAAGLDVRLNTLVTDIRWSKAGVRVQAAGGAVYEGDCAIITLPLAVLKAETVRFDPPLPPDKRAAIAALNMAPALKLIYRFAQPVRPDLAALYSRHNPPMWWTPTAGHEGAVGQVWTAFVTGDYARHLRALGEQGALDAALRTFATELGRSLTPEACRWVDWAGDPFALGGYSSDAPGSYGARAVLARCIDDRLFWAGEATANAAAAGTVHGAYLAGVRAAQEVLGIQQGL